MLLDADACWKALRTHDPRFDGRFFVGVRSTRVYCRPVCRVRAPRRENCRFYPSAAAAEVAGFRPCLRCRPELAPGFAAIDASAQLVGAAVALIEDGFLESRSLEALADRLGVTGRHLRRMFEAELGVAPIDHAQTQRLLLAKRLLTDTAMPVADVAFASGFASVRRMNALFRERYRMAPTRVRATRPARAEGLSFSLGYRAPYAFDAVLGFLAFRAVRGVEEVDAGAFRRVLSIPHRDARHEGWIEVRHDARRGALRVRVSPALSRVIPQVLARVRHVFDLACDPAEVAQALGPLATGRPGLRVPGTFDAFEAGVRAIAGQQVSVRAMTTLLARIAERFGRTPAGLPQGLRHAFPDPAVLADAGPGALAALGMPQARARSLVALSRAVADGFVLAPGVDVDDTMRRLCELPGVGPWTASYIAMRGLGWPDAFLPTDLGVRRALGGVGAAQAERIAEAWRPWRAYAVVQLWMQRKEEQR